MSMTVTGVDLGSLELRPANKLTIIQTIQRQASESRVRSIAANWDDEKAELLFVAKINDGEYKGREHIYDGGTRWRAKMEYGGDEGVNYPFRCWIRRMTYLEAAQKFLTTNGESMKPNAFSRYAVGVQAGRPAPLAVREALTTLGLVASPSRAYYGDGEPGSFAAFAAAERIVTREFANSGDWGAAANLLRWSIDIGRRAYPQHGYLGTAIGHDADIVQAIAQLGTLNTNFMGHPEREGNLIHAITTWLADSERKTRLFETGQMMRPEQWRLAAIDATRNSGGSSSRGSQIARQIGLNHNRQLKPALSIPPAPR